MIDWSQPAATLAAWLERPLSAAQATPLAGGDINQVFRLDCGAERIFSKLNDACREHFPIGRGYSECRDLYKFYHLLNHANLFGRVYAAEARQVIERLFAQLH